VLGGKLTACEASFGDRLSRLVETVSGLIAGLAKEVTAREGGDKREHAALAGVSSALERIAMERLAGEERASKAVADVRNSSDAERSSRESSNTQLVQAIDSLSDRVNAHNKGHTIDFGLLRTADEGLREQIKEEQASRKAGEAALQAELVKRSEAEGVARLAIGAKVEEIREWVKLLIEQGLREARADREASSNEIRRQVEALAESAKETDKNCALLGADFTRLDCAHTEHRSVIDCIHEEVYKRVETHAHSATSDVRSAIDAHHEFAEGLDREQQLLMVRVNECLENEAKGRSVLERRVYGVENDVRKVRAHLPILFAAPSAFG